MLCVREGGNVMYWGYRGSNNWQISGVCFYGWLCLVHSFVVQLPLCTSWTSLSSLGFDSSQYHEYD